MEYWEPIFSIKNSPTLNYFWFGYFAARQFRGQETEQKIQRGERFPFALLKCVSSIVLEDSRAKKYLLPRALLKWYWSNAINSKGAIKKVNCLMKLPRGQDGKRVLMVAFKHIKGAGETSHSKKLSAGWRFGVFCDLEDPLKALQRTIQLVKKVGSTNKNYYPATAKR